MIFHKKQSFYLSDKSFIRCKQSWHSYSCASSAQILQTQICSNYTQDLILVSKIHVIICLMPRSTLKEKTPISIMAHCFCLGYNSIAFLSRIRAMFTFSSLSLVTGFSQPFVSLYKAKLCCYKKMPDECFSSPVTSFHS